MAGFHQFNQNNSGGHFDFDPVAGITHHVLIEGEAVSDVVEKALAIGIYFDGCDAGMDCGCCGDRWYQPWSDAQLDKEPTVYSTPVSEFRALIQFMKEGAEVCVHYLDGRKEWYGAGPQ
jgi:hypothetical protein